MKAIRLSYKEILDIFTFDPPRHLDFKKNIDLCASFSPESKRIKYLCFLCTQGTAHEVLVELSQQ